MKTHKVAIGLLSLLVVPALFIGSTKDSFVTVFADVVPVEGYYAKASENSSLSGSILFDLEENDVPVSADGFKAQAYDSITLLKDNGNTVYLPYSYINTLDVFYKQSATQYTIPKTLFDEVGGIEVGDTIVLNGNFVNSDYSLHIKESRLYVYTKDAIVTVPHKVNDISNLLETARPSQEVYKDHNWSFLLWVDPLPFEDVLMTVDDGYYPTSIHCFYVNGKPHANCRYDGLRRRTDEKEIFICAQGQIGSTNPAVGTVVVIDGIFNYKNYIPGQYPLNPILDLEPGESYGIQIDLLSLIKVGGGVDDYQIIDLRQYLMDQFDLLYDADLYEPDYYQSIMNIRDELESDIYSVSSAKDIYAFYNAATALMDSIEISPDKFLEFKTKYAKEITEYVDISKYYEEQANTIREVINTCLSKIESATKTKQIVDAVNLAKSDIDTVSTRLSLMEKAILNGELGYKDYLCAYDSVTLNDLSLGNSQEFHGQKDQRDNDINTYVQNKNQFNSFATGPENPKGNVEFNFTYKADAVPSYGANITITLRGVKYNGYKFCLGTDSRGFFFVCTSNNADVEGTFTGDEGKIKFALNTEYRIRISAIDLIEGNRTWIRMVINGFEYMSKIFDSLPECVNPRVDLCYNLDDRSDVPGVATIGNYYPNNVRSTVAPIYCGRFNAEATHGDSTRTMQLSLEDNELKYSEEGVFSYALDEGNIKLIRDNTEYELSRSDIPSISKLSSNSYQLHISKLYNSEINNIQDGDIMVVSGYFAYFDEDTKVKTLYEIGTCKFTYSVSANAWGALEELDDVRQDALKKLDYYASEVNLAKYDEAEQQTITSIVNNAKGTINSASSIDVIKETLSNASLAINEVFTSFEKYQNTAISTLSTYKESEYSQYREEELQDILAFKETFTLSIRGASSTSEIDSLLAQALAKIDAVLTDAELKEIELNNAKHQGEQAIKDRYAALVTDSMSEEDLNKLNNETLAAISEVKAATSVESVNNIVDAFLKAHPLPKEPSSGGGCGGNIVTSSIVLSSLAALLLTLLIIKKWKYNANRRTNHE